MCCYAAAEEAVDGALAALEEEAARTAPDMIAQNVTNTLYAYTTLGRMVGPLFVVISAICCSQNTS